MAAFFADIDDEEHFKNGTNSLPTRRNPEIRVLDEFQRKRLQQLETTSEMFKARIKEIEDGDTKKELVKKQKELAARIAKIGRLTMVTKTLAKPRETRVLPRGNFLDETGPIVNPSYPEFMQGLGGKSKSKLPNRLELARWLTDSNKPSGLLTSRVFVNRMWYLLYGRGLAPDLDDFGGQGLPPIHPELLDNLAIFFVKENWNVKKLIREMVLTRTYQLSSNPTPGMREKDPENHFFARQTRVRIPAEMIRDNALAVSGLLVTQVGGGSVKPYQPPGYYRHLNFPTRKYSHDTDQRQYQRGVYVHWQRQFLHPMLRAFDAPRREECTAERPTSNTPNAALVLLNDPTFVESARVFAERIVIQKDDLKSQISLAFETALSRAPDEFEVKVLSGLYESNFEIYKADPNAAKQLLTVGMKEYDGELDVVQLAAFTQVCRALFNLDEFVSRR